MGATGVSFLLMAAFVAVLGGAGVVRAIDPTGADYEERRRVLSDFELTEEIHYAHSWGYESEPPPEIADYVVYFPPKKYGTEKHRRELRTLITLRTQAVSSPPPPPPDDDTDVIFNETDSGAITYDSTYDDTVLPEPSQPEYPVNVTSIPPDVFGNLTYNTLQVFGTVPRYSKKFGIAMKSKANGRWYTWVDATNWWWGADDWSTAFWSCRYTQPKMPGGFDCTVDRTCPGCDRCRGKHCFYNYNTRTYCSNTKCKSADDLVGIVTQAKFCAERPIHCGMSRRVGTDLDIGWPGYGAP